MGMFSGNIGQRKDGIILNCKICKKSKIHIEVIDMSLHDLIQNAKNVDLFPEFKKMPWYKRYLFAIRVKIAVMLCEVKNVLFKRSDFNKSDMHSKMYCRQEKDKSTNV